MIVKYKSMKLNVYVILPMVLICSRIIKAQGTHSPENIAFEQASSKDMVNLVTGDFAYNIPLLQVPGIGGSYPISLNYHAGITTNQEASWVGLGWNISVGAINRNVKGYPDDWNGKAIKSGVKNANGDLNTYTTKAGNSSNWKIGIANSFQKATSFMRTSGYASSNVESLLNSYNVHKQDNTIYGPLYFKNGIENETNWGTQKRDKIMDSYTNPINSSLNSDAISNDQSNALSFANYDDYVVSAEGLVGTITPRRFELGSLTRKGYVLSSYPNASEGPSAYKEFIYNNRYAFNKDRTDVHFYFNNEKSGFLKIPEGSESITGSDPIWSNSFSGGYLNYTNSDGKTFYNSATKRKGEGKFVQYYTNAEMQNSQLQLGQLGIMEYEKLLGQRNTGMFDSDGIGGFSITNEQGVTYHYGLPVYNISENNISEEAGNINSNFSDENNVNLVATTWLLTGITGADFVDKGTIGIIDDADIGYWVKFDYGKWSDGYIWRSPYNGYNKITSPTGLSSYSWGRKQIYYLNSIKTKTHTAYFIKSLRSDNLGKDVIDDYNKDDQVNLMAVPGSNFLMPIVVHSTSSIYIPEKTKTLKLDKIILVRNEDLNLSANSGSPLVSPQTGNTSWSYYNGYYDNNGFHLMYQSPPVTNSFNLYYNNEVLDLNDISGQEALITSKALKIIDFNYDYSLCQGTPNSNAVNNGKLTLLSFTQKELNGTLLQPKHDFTYYNTTNYNYSYTDNWGYYAGASETTTGGKNDQVIKNDVNSWSLKDVIFPLGGKMTVEYEGDQYSTEIYPVTSGLFYGGGIRVSKIKLQDENGFNQTKKYTYSIGATTYAPRDYVRFIPYINEIPGPNVMYQTVTESDVSDNNLEETKTVYTFDVYGATSSINGFYNVKPMILVTDIQPASEVYTYTSGNFWKHVFTRSAVIHDQTSALGRILSEKKISKDGKILSQTKYDYSSISEIKTGLTQETYMDSKQFVIWDQHSHTSNSSLYYHTYTSKVNYPSVLKSITKIEDDIENKVLYSDYDIVNGQPKITETSAFSGSTLKDEVVFAYDKYPSMNSKLFNITNKNLVAASAQKTSYIKGYDNAYKLLGSDVSTFSNNWNYRKFESGVFSDAIGTEIWRPYQSFRWKSIPKSDGTIDPTEYVNFNFSSPTQNANWIKMSENKRYDYNSNNLEINDINEIPSSTKIGYKNQYPLVECSGASYHEFCYSGAEDLIQGSTAVFEGEVTTTPGTVYNSSAFAHTGKSCIKLTNNQYGFNYQKSIDNVNFKKGKTYKASVWLHQINAVNGILYCHLKKADNSSVVWQTTDINSLTTKHFGSWYLLVLDIEIPSNTLATTIEVGTLNVNNSNSQKIIFMDDFRLHPVESNLTSYVYDSKTGWLSASLNNVNIATKFIYDNTGRVIKKYQETANGFKLVMENKYNFGKQP